MMHNAQALYDELRKTKTEIEEQLNLLKAGRPAEGYRDREYNFHHDSTKAALLAARATCLQGMAQLKAANAATTAPSGRGRQW
jgi:hypothetical protein